MTLGVGSPVTPRAGQAFAAIAPSARQPSPGAFFTPPAVSRFDYDILAAADLTNEE